MAIKVEIKGILNDYDPISERKGYYIMYFRIFRPAFKNEFGDKVGNDQYYAITAISNDKKHLEKMQTLLRCKVTAQCYLNGRQIVGTRGISYHNQLMLSGNLEQIK